MSAIQISLTLAAALALAISAGCGGDDATDSSTTSTTSAAGLTCPEGGAEDALETAMLVGETVDQASATAEDHGCEVRVVVEDGEQLAVTLDFNPDRINVAVAQGTITKIVSLG